VKSVPVSRSSEAELAVMVKDPLSGEILLAGPRGVVSDILSINPLMDSRPDLSSPAASPEVF